MDLARVHGEEETGAPVEETLADGLLRGLDHLAGEAADPIPRGGLVVRGRGDGHLLEEDGDALYGLVAERALLRGELECVADLVREVSCLDRVADRLRCLFCGIAEAGRMC